jgi:hypothetical protein
MGRQKPGYYRGKHYTEYVEDVKRLKREDKYDDAEHLLWALVAATEAEVGVGMRGVAPWYYEQLAIIYRKRKAYQSEIAILERYASVQPPDLHKGRLMERLEKARALAGRK